MVLMVQKIESLSVVILMVVLMLMELLTPIEIAIGSVSRMILLTGLMLIIQRLVLMVQR